MSRRTSVSYFDGCRGEKRKEKEHEAHLMKDFETSVEEREECSTNASILQACRYKNAPICPWSRFMPAFTRLPGFPLARGRRLDAVSR